MQTITAFPMIHCSCSKPFPTSYNAALLHNGIDNERGDGLSKQECYSSKSRSLEALNASQRGASQFNMKVAGVQKKRRYSRGREYGARYSPRPAIAVPNSCDIQFSDDLRRYHYFCTSEVEQANKHVVELKPSTKYEQPPCQPHKRGIMRHDRWSWSTAYSAFDYWCFYRIELLKYQLHQALQHQERRSHVSSPQTGLEM